jgi:CHAT domain-containing protein
MLVPGAARWRGAVALATLVAAVARAAAQDPPTTPPAWAVVLAQGQSGELTVTASRDEFVRVVADTAADAVLTVITSTGTPVARLARLDAIDRPSGVAWIADAPGTYRVRLQAAAGGFAPGRAHRLRVQERRPATARDRELVLAAAAQQAGEDARRAGTARSAQDALQHYARALELSRAGGDRRAEADARLGLGLTRWSLSEYDAALEHYGSALEGFRASGDRASEAFVLQRLALTHRARGDLDRARRLHEDVVALARATGNERARGEGLNGLGRVSYETADMQGALDAFGQALAIARTIHDRAIEGYAVNNTGVVYWAMGDHASALEFLEQGLAARRAVGDRQGEVASLSNMGMVLLELGRLPQSATVHERALAIAKGLGNRRLEGGVLQELGRTRLRQDRAAAAADILARSVVLCRDVGDRFCEASSLSQLAAAEIALGRPQPAREHLDAALAVARAHRDPYEEASSLVIRARLAGATGDLAAAQDDVQSALQIIEAQRINVVSPELRASYLASTRSAYETAIDLLMRRHAADPEAGHAARALDVSERARARSLLDSLSAAAAGVRVSVDPVLKAREITLRRALEQGGTPSGELDPAVLDLIAIDRTMEAEIRAAQSRHARLTQGQPLTLADIQARLGPADAMLEFALGDQRSYLWVITPTSLRAHRLPGRAVLEAAAVRAHAALEQSHRPGMRTQARRALISVGQLLLGGAAASLTADRLIIVADGALQFVPFAAISTRADGEPLIVRHEIVTLPSASTLSALGAPSPDRRAPDRTLALLADPVFEPGDTRVSRRAPGAAARQGLLPARLDRSIADASPGRLQRLAYTAEEARQIAALVSPSEALVALGLDATRERALAADVGRYRFIHFATHALVNTRHPDLSGIVLSTVGRDGEPRDGFLRLPDIYAMQLSADVVVLSACQTALGRDVRGEGLVGLSRGFLHAGARSVVSTLWEVRDRQTSELMTRFYQAMLRDGRTPSAALREAQLRTLRDPASSAPFYWAGFVLNGDWR